MPIYSVGSGRDLTAPHPHIADPATHQQVRTMAACGLSPEQICQVLPCTRIEFERCYEETYANGSIEATVAVGSQILAAAVDKDHPQFFQCASFWMRSRAGWRDVREIKTEQALPEQQKQALIDAIINEIALSDLHKEKVKK